MAKFSKVFICILLCCTLLCSCSSIPDDLDPIVVSNMDMTITLPGYFENMIQGETAEVDGFFAYGYSEIMITGLRDTYELFETVPTLEEYANSLIENSDVSAEVEIIDGLTTFTYRQLSNSESYTYFAVVFAGSESFWMITASCTTMNFDTAKDKLLEIIKTTEVA